jgi:hypothetical protein
VREKREREREELLQNIWMTKQRYYTPDLTKLELPPFIVQGKCVSVPIITPNETAVHTFQVEANDYSGTTGCIFSFLFLNITESVSCVSCVSFVCFLCFVCFVCFLCFVCLCVSRVSRVYFYFLFFLVVKLSHNFRIFYIFTKKKKPEKIFTNDILMCMILYFILFCSILFYFVLFYIIIFDNT